MTFLRVLQYLGSPAIIIVVVTFFIRLPGQLRQRNHELWQMVQAGEGRVFDSERVGILEQLNHACFKLEGLEAEGAYLSGMRLDGCRGLVGWLLGGRWSGPGCRRPTSTVRAALAAVHGGATPFRLEIVGHRLLSRQSPEDRQWLTEHLAPETVLGQQRVPPGPTLASPASGSRPVR